MRAFIAVLLLGSLASSFGQSKPAAKPKQPTARPAATSAPSKPAAPKPKYLTGPLDLAASSLGPDFQGHDVQAIYEAIKGSSALKEKSEFETTVQFETRRKGFADQSLVGSLTPKDTIAFVMPSESRISGPEFKYDADSQTMAFKLHAWSKEFLMDAGRPKLDTVLLRSVVVSKGSYIGSNAYGAKVEVEKTHSEDYGVGFGQGNWLFRNSKGYSREFTYLFAMPPDQAKVLKENGRILLLCRLAEPWLHATAHGHDAKIDEPYETIVGDNYLQAVPKELWMYNQKTGEVLVKLSQSSVTQAEEEQLKLKLKKTPLILDVSSNTVNTFYITVDDQPERHDSLFKETKTFAAQRKLVIRLDNPLGLSDLAFKLNGKPYTPTWTKDVYRIGSYERIRSATAVVTVP